MRTRGRKEERRGEERREEKERGRERRRRGEGVPVIHSAAPPSPCSVSGALPPPFQM